MKEIISEHYKNNFIISSATILVALIFIFYLPALSHLLNFPLYYFEPIRFVILLSFLITGKKNAFILAFILPVFSYLISSHPSFIKSILIGAELLLNITLLLFLLKKINNAFLSMFISIIVSKAFYYFVKYLLINAGFINSNLVSTPLYIQIIMIFFLSILAYVILYKFNFKDLLRV